MNFFSHEGSANTGKGSVSATQAVKILGKGSV